MYQTPKRIYNTIGSTTRVNGLLGDVSSNGGARSHGDCWEGLTNGIATGFGGDALIPEDSTATQVPQLLVAASAGADLATPVAYWFQKQLLRVRVGSTTAAGVPATSGLKRVITENKEARGVLRMGLGDVNAAAHIILDQGGLKPLSTSVDFEVHFDIASVTNGTILATNGFADIGIFGGAIDATTPANVANAAAYYVKITAGKVSVYSTATTDTLLGQAGLPSGSFVLSFIYDSNRRKIYATIDGVGIGSDGYTLPAAVTDVELGARVCHLAAYTAAGAAPLTVDIDGIIAHQLAYGDPVTA